MQIRTLSLAAAVAAVVATASAMPPSMLPFTTEFIDIPADAAVVFTGTVTRAGQPVAGATVTIMPWGASATTDAAGRYSIPVADAKPGNAAIVRVATRGYADVTRTIRVQTSTVRTDFVLDAPETDQDAPRRPTEQRENEARQERASKAVLDGRVGTEAIAPMMAPATSNVSAGAAGCCDHLRHADPRDYNTEGYAAIDENPFLGAKTNPLSTFSIDVDRASYANVRRFLRGGQMPPVDAVRIEELVNYFHYEDPAPDGADTPFRVTTELADAPWRPAHKLLRIALKAKSIDVSAAPRSNLVFLIDVSGSMKSPDKLPLLKQAFGLLVNELRPGDRVAMVVYAGAAGLVLEPTDGSDKEKILEALERLEAGGSTAGGAGIRLAYDVARKHHIQNGNNRVILATDGDFNVGASSDAEMTRLIEEKRRQGTFLTVLGFGTGNLKDSKMEALADKGNGNYAYIDGLMEARKVLIEEMGGTLFAVAKDVKLQVEFNPERVKGYRLIGYENRLLAAEDFSDDRKDAGELGAGHTVTALYEVVPVDAKSDVEIRGVDPLRYQAPPATRRSDGELAFVKLRWKKPDGDKSALIEHPVRNRDTRPTADFTFSAAVAAFGMILRDSEHRGDATYERVLAWAKQGLGEDRGGYRAGFIELVEQARSIDAPVAAGEGSGSRR